MVENLLAKAIRTFLAEKLKDFLLPCEIDGQGKSLQIINGYLPPRTTKEKVTDEDLYPFVLVRPESAETDRESTVVTVAIIIGTYSKEAIGHEYALNVMTRIREALCTLPNLQLERKYQLEFPIKWEGYDSPAWPFWQIDMKTEWIIRSPKPVLPNNGEIYDF